VHDAPNIDEPGAVAFADVLYGVDDGDGGRSCGHRARLEACGIGVKDAAGRAFRRIWGKARDKIRVTPNQGEGIGPRASAMETEMRHLILKIGLASVCALGFIGLNQPAKAFSPPPLDEGRPLVIHVQDTEDEAVESDLESDLYPPGSEDEMSDEPMMSDEMDEKKGDMENEMMDEPE
jgi:hypothetical protein